MKFYVTEIEVLKREFTRVQETVKQLNSREKRRKESELRILHSIYKKFNVELANLNTTEELNITLTRPEIRFIEKYLIARIQMILMSVIPGYEARISKAGDEETRINYQNYLIKATNSLEKYKEILRKIKESL